MKDTEKQATWWKYAAWTSPFVALAILLGEFLLGFETRPTAFIIVITFVATSVFWWWWAINRIVYMIKCSHKMEDSFNELRKDFKEIKKDVGNWQRREQETN